MSFISFKKTNLDDNKTLVDELYFIEINIFEDFLYCSSTYLSPFKDRYFSKDFQIKISKPIKNANTDLDINKYYMCFDEKGKSFGFRKPNSYFIKISEFDRQTGFENPNYPELKIKLFMLLFESQFITLIKKNN